MSSFGVVEVDPLIQIGLQGFDSFVELLAECDLIKLLQDCFVEAFANPVGLGRFNLGLGVVNVVDCQEELVVVFVDPAAVFGSAVGQNAQHRKVVFLMERQHPIVEQISRSYRRFGGVELGMCHLAIGVHIGLLIDPPDTLESANIERVLRAQIARVRGLNLATGFIVQLLLLKGLNLSFGALLHGSGVKC